MVILLKNGRILTFPSPNYAVYEKVHDKHVVVKVKKQKSSVSSLAEINYDCVSVVFPDDDFYISTLGQELVRNLKPSED